MEYNLRHRDLLLEQFADQLEYIFRDNPRIQAAGCIEVVLKHPHHDKPYVFGFIAALRMLIDDLYWDERGDWSDARELELRVM